MADPEVRLAPRYRVFIHNDDVTPMEFVIHVLEAIFHLPYIRALQVMLEAHETGVAHVVTLEFEEAEFRVERAHSLARGRGYPLTFTMEPED